MSIVGIGVDIVHITRFRDGIVSERLVNRVFSTQEILYCRARQSPERHFAARFAAKEAAIKALASGGLNLTITQVEVVSPVEGGAPKLVLREGGNGRGLPNLPGGLRLHLSLSHDGDHAVAMVVAEIDAE